jgi:hypothetical protein
VPEAGIPGAWAFTSAEDADTIEVWLQALKELILQHNPLWKPSCFVVDCCDALIKALRCAPFLCLYANPVRCPTQQLTPPAGAKLKKRMQ